MVRESEVSDVLPSNSDSARVIFKEKFMIRSRRMLKSVGDRRQPRRTPTEVWNHSPMMPWASTELLALVYSCWMVLISFWPMLNYSSASIEG